MYGVPSALVSDIANAIQDDRLSRIAEARLIREATRGQHGRYAVMASIRRAFGGALIALGQSVHGERTEAIDSTTVPSTGTLRLAR